jgi:geranylgeranyl pyrophosphate synthase
MIETSLTQNALDIVCRNGKFALAQACQKILTSRYDDGIIREALHYYAKNVLPRVLPIFPALITLSSKAVGFTSKNLQSVATAILLVTSSGDIHDDIVDNSTRKFSRKTIVGKYGKDIALLAGDVLLVQGMTALQNECDLSIKQRKTIADSVAAAMVEIVKAEAIETSLWHKTNVTPEEYFDVIRLKGGVAELHCRIGGIIGGGNEEAIDNLAGYGRVIGVLSTLKEEFVDMSSYGELEHRIKNELPPYPMLCAMQNKGFKKKTATSKNAKFSDEDLIRIAEFVLGSLEVEKLTSEFREFGRKELANNNLLKGNDRAEELVLLLEALSDELLIV